MSEDQKPSNATEILLGVAIAVAAVVAAEIILIALTAVLERINEEVRIFMTITTLQVGWTQILYLPALAIYLGKEGRHPHRATGIWIVFCILFLLTSLCNASVGPPW